MGECGIFSLNRILPFCVYPYVDLAGKGEDVSDSSNYVEHVPVFCSLLMFGKTWGGSLSY